MFLFRADGNPAVGAGHVMRCLSIAEAAKESCRFITADSCFRELIISRGYQVSVLNTDYSHMEDELEQLLALLQTLLPSVLFVDSYFVTAAYLSALRETCGHISCKLVYIDDVLAFAYPCDLLLNYNIYGPDKEQEYRDMYRSAEILPPRFLLGPFYAPLRREFQNLPERIVNQTVRHVLISTGGSDPEHIAKDLAAYMVSHPTDLTRLAFHFIIGAMNEDMEQIRQLTAQTPNIYLHVNVNNMAELMLRSDLAVSAAGSTLYELCAVQTPAITYVLADNQIPGAEGFERHGILRCVGDARKLGNQLPKRLIHEVLRLAECYDERAEIAQRQKTVVDGNGAGHVVAEIAENQSHPRSHPHIIKKTMP